MNIRTLTSTVVALALGAALLVPATAQAAPATTPAADGLVRVHDAEQGFGVVEPSGVGTMAESSYVEFPEGGGTWYHGVKGGQVYSNFYHYTRKHGSSVKNGNGSPNSSRIVGPRETSNASIGSTMAGNSAYYRFG